MEKLELNEVILPVVGGRKKFVSHIKWFALNVLKAQKSFHPMAWLLVGEEAHVFVGNFCETGLLKDMFTVFLREKAYELKADGYAFATETWSVELDKSEVEKVNVITRPSQHEDRIEAFSILFEVKDQRMTFQYHQNRDAANRPQPKLVSKTNDRIDKAIMGGRFLNIIRRP